MVGIQENDIVYAQYLGINGLKLRCSVMGRKQQYESFIAYSTFPNKTSKLHKQRSQFIQRLFSKKMYHFILLRQIQTMKVHLILHSKLVTTLSNLAKVIQQLRILLLLCYLSCGSTDVTKCAILFVVARYLYNDEVEKTSYCVILFQNKHQELIYAKLLTGFSLKIILAGAIVVICLLTEQKNVECFIGLRAHIRGWPPCTLEPLKHTQAEPCLQGFN